MMLHVKVTDISFMSLKDSVVQELLALDSKSGLRNIKGVRITATLK